MNARDDERTDAFLDDRRERCVDFMRRGHIQDKQLKPKGACGLLQFRGLTRLFRIVRVAKHGDSHGIGD